MSRLLITIDGPAASGKSTVARMLAEKLNAAFLDTGAMYRAVTLAAMRKGIELADQTKIVELLYKTTFKFTASPRGMSVHMDKIDVTAQIRDPEVTANARCIASSSAVRHRLVEMQRRFARKYDRIVTEGRDQGTVAFPDADVKFFLTAGIDERARRRYADLKSAGKEQSLDVVRKDILRRDDSDQTRSVGPLKPAPDAIIVDTTDLTLEKVLRKLLDCVDEKCPKKD